MGETGASRHFSDDLLEQYGFQRLPEPEVERVEEHLLICEACRSKLSEIEAYVAVMKAAADGVHKKPPDRAWLSRPGLVRTVIATSPLWLGTLAIIAVLIFYSQPQRVPQASEVELKAERGDAAALIAHAPAKTSLWLTIDATSLPNLPAYRLEIVDGRGGRIWQTSLAPEQNRLRTSVARQLARGTYWVRLYGAQGPDSLLREYGLELN